MKDFDAIWCLKHKHLQLFLFSLEANAHKLSGTSNSQEMGDQDSHSSYTERIQHPTYSLSKETVGPQGFMQVEKFPVAFPLRCSWRWNCAAKESAFTVAGKERDLWVRSTPVGQGALWPKTSSPYCWHISLQQKCNKGISQEFWTQVIETRVQPHIQLEGWFKH